MTDTETNHTALMNSVYRHQRYIYDATRKYYLLGRDHAIAQLDAKPGERVLEVACGTGRNLLKIHQRYPGVKLYGLDISSEMLATANSKLRDRATLAQADATNFSPHTLFAEDKFEHILLSYSVSMIPDWQSALCHCAEQLADGGKLHVVDFSDQRKLPLFFGKALRGWLAKFHVSPRYNLGTELQSLSNCRPATLQERQLFRRYSQYYCYHNATAA